jgi:hypothetical protein
MRKYANGYHAQEQYEITRGVLCFSIEYRALGAAKNAVAPCSKAIVKRSNNIARP